MVNKSYSTDKNVKIDMLYAVIGVETPAQIMSK